VCVCVCARACVRVCVRVRACVCAVHTRLKCLDTGQSVEQPSNLLSSFWSHPATRTAAEVPSILRRCYYQLAPPTTGTKASEVSPVDSFKVGFYY
jgi:hypothetical protein